MDVANYDHKDSRYFGNTRPEIAVRVPAHARRVLDVGCGEGGFGAQLMRQRPELEVWGIEPTERAAEVAGERLARVFNCGVEEALHALADHDFDCITLNDVLEHLVDPWSVLAALTSKLKPDGVVIASIPNLRFYPVLRALVSGGDFTYTRQGVLDVTHLRFFTKRSMVRLFEQSGFAVTDVAGFYWVPLPPWLRVVDRLSRRALEDMHYMQFILCARPSGEPPTHVLANDPLLVNTGFAA